MDRPILRLATELIVFVIMIYSLSPRVLLACLVLLLPGMIQAQTPSALEPAADTASEADSTPNPSDRNQDAPDSDRFDAAFDPALVGLPEFPSSLAAPDAVSKALDLIDARITEKTAAIEAATAEAMADTSADAADPDVDMDADALALQQAARETRLSALERQRKRLQELRRVVQRRAGLAERLTEAERELADREARLAAMQTEGIALEPPFPVSLLDQARAELTLNQSLAAVAETRIATAEQRLADAENALTIAVRERRAARDRLTQAETENVQPLEREALSDALEEARLNEILARQQRMAAEQAREAARLEQRLAESAQAVLAQRIEALQTRVELPREALQARLEELDGARDRMRAQIETLQQRGDQAEADLYRARQRLAASDRTADQTLLEEWVLAHQAEQSAARTGLDSLNSALANLEQMRRLWEQRYQLMHDAETLDLAGVLHQNILDTAAAIGEKEAIESRLNSLRSIQLAQERRLLEADLSASRREALETRGAAHALAERHGRELLQTQESLIALLQGMRPQIEAVVEQQNWSLQLLQAQETLAEWWEAEWLVIDDQSIRMRELITALAMFLVVLLIVSLIRLGARRALNRRKVPSAVEPVGDLRLVLSAVAGNTSQLFVLIAAFYVAMRVSGLAGPTVVAWLWNLLIVAFYIQLGLWANAAMADYFIRKRTRKERRDPSTVTGYGVMMVFFRVGIWLTVLVSLMAYFQYPIAGLLGALGVGSVAVGFALNSILSDVFSSMAIVLDKPFRVGDFVKAGDTVGVIEYTGIKTTRIRSLSGEQVVLSNSDLLSSRIHNFKQFRERRIVFRIGVVYQTPRARLEQIPHMLREAIEGQPQTRFDRAHFAEYGDFALLFEAVYYVLSPDYGLYMDIQQGINLDLHQRFEEAGISFAYPTQELILRRGPPIAPAVGAAG
jgi:MscS family membrane protein